MVISKSFLSSSVEFIEQLSKWPRVRIRDKKYVSEKLEAMASKAGPSKLMVLADFDLTLSRHRKNGQKCIITDQMVADLGADRDPEGYKQILANSEKYKQIERSREISDEEKWAHMEQWWRNTHRFIIKQKFTEQFLHEAVKNSRDLLLRLDRCAELLLLLNRQKVPVIVFSAGITNIIQFVFDHQIGTSNLNNLHIIGNQMIFDHCGICVGFADPLVHTYNKNATVVPPELVNKMAKNGPISAIMLLGDSLADVQMDVGIGQQVLGSSKLKIGFFNFDFDQLLPQFMDVYDIVLIDEQTMEVPLCIIKHINGM